MLTIGVPFLLTHDRIRESHSQYCSNKKKGEKEDKKAVLLAY
jgi:hypothetical protein